MDECQKRYSEEKNQKEIFQGNRDENLEAWHDEDEETHEKYLLKMRKREKHPCKELAYVKIHE